MLTDIHTHVLPNVDDGAKSWEEAVGLLNELAKQGVTAVCATPHFYAEACPPPLVHAQRVAERFEQLKSEFSGDLPELFLGHEVHFFGGIGTCDDIRALTYGGSGKILIELPFGRFDKRVVDEIAELAINYKLSPVLAHIERYADCGCFEAVLDVIDDGFCTAQLNCDSLLLRHTKKLALQLIDDGYISYLATDTHSLDLRPPHMEKALKTVSSKLGKKIAAALVENANAFAAELK